MVLAYCSLKAEIALFCGDLELAFTTALQFLAEIKVPSPTPTQQRTRSKHLYGPRPASRATVGTSSICPTACS
jgi:hypothetical protein